MNKTLHTSISLNCEPFTKRKSEALSGLFSSNAIRFDNVWGLGFIDSIIERDEITAIFYVGGC